MNKNTVSTVKLHMDSVSLEAAAWICWNIYELAHGVDYDGSPIDCLKLDPEVELEYQDAEHLQEKYGVHVECPTCGGDTEVGYNNTYNRDPQYDEAKQCHCKNGILGIADAFHAPTPEEFVDKWYGFDPDMYRD